jgi:hypothetical protein
MNISPLSIMALGCFIMSAVVRLKDEKSKWQPLWAVGLIGCVMDIALGALMRMPH